MTTQTSLSPILLVIDLQQGMVEISPADWGPRSTPNLVPNVKHLLSTWRSKKWPILHVQHDSVYDPSSPINALHPETFAIHPCAAPEGEEPLFVKNVGSPFVATGLRAKVEELGVLGEVGAKRKIVIIGMSASECISDTTRNGADLGYEIVVVGDATAAFGMDDWNGGKYITAAEAHAAALSMLCGYARVTTTEKVVDVLGY